MRHDVSQMLDAAVPVVVGIVVAVGVALRADAETRLIAIALAVAAAAALILRRRLPVVTLALSGGLVLGVFALDHAAGAIAVVAPATALYSLALVRGCVQLAVAAAATAAAVVLADTLLAGGHRHDLTLQTLAHVALVAVPLLAAEAHRNRRSYIKLLLERLELAERTREEEAQRRVEQERLRIARDLHDVVAHTLTTINVQAGVAAHLIDRNPDNARSALKTIENASHEALDELRTILGVLRNPDSDGAPLEPTPNLDSVRELIEQSRGVGLDVHFEIDGEQPERVPDAVQLAAFRILQESLTNAQRHAAGASARVRLRFEPDRLLLAVENAAGAGTNADGSLGVGILGMRERAVALGGTLDADRFASGFRVAADLPYRRSA
ncbi:MAG: sensor histidine kinase [Gaiellaceae bacterium]